MCVYKKIIFAKKVMIDGLHLNIITASEGQLWARQIFFIISTSHRPQLVPETYEGKILLTISF